MFDLPGSRDSSLLSGCRRGWGCTIFKVDFSRFRDIINKTMGVHHGCLLRQVILFNDR